MSDKQTVLIVDDDVDFARVNRFILEKAGYEVILAHTGEEGIAKARELKPDAILLDFMIETPNQGAWVAQAIRDNADLRDVPILLLTAIGRIKPWVAKDVRPNPDWLPVDKVLEKPVTAERLLVELEQALAVRQR